MHLIRITVVQRIKNQNSLISFYILRFSWFMPLLIEKNNISPLRDIVNPLFHHSRKKLRPRIRSIAMQARTQRPDQIVLAGARKSEIKKHSRGLFALCISLTLFLSLPPRPFRFDQGKVGVQSRGNIRSLLFRPGGPTSTFAYCRRVSYTYVCTYTTRTFPSGRAIK